MCNNYFINATGSFIQMSPFYRDFRMILRLSLSSSVTRMTAAVRLCVHVRVRCPLTARAWAAWRGAAWRPGAAPSVGEAVGLVQLEQQVVGEVEGGEADSHGHRPLQPVHAQAFVQPPHESLLSRDGVHGPQNGAVGPARDAGRLHAPSHHVQRVGGRLSDQARAGAESQALVRVRLGSLGSL